ncbi:hypothetical protein PISL3812_00847 [Talaromyces islandicus]|uniref:Aminoglycoside phosphotransferase domain-containing protein n=1 Tax=Talaromyces islandicus TaxID=28573 RepID=A0A0U1LM43_TALIS|nr:hypothetical protein PISL3812_00847 [Talaromyces islandicus]
MDVLPDLRGLKWAHTLWGLECRWATKLDKSSIKEAAKAALHLPESCGVTFLAKAAYNKLYIVESDNNEAVVKVTHWTKMENSRRSFHLQWLAQTTNLPIPRVLAYHIERSNVVGFEWIIMNKILGKPWVNIWKELSFTYTDNITR